MTSRVPDRNQDRRGGPLPAAAAAPGAPHPHGAGAGHPAAALDQDLAKTQSAVSDVELSSSRPVTQLT